MSWTLKHPSTVFIFVALVFGLIFCFRIAPLSGTDEFTHFPRAYQIQDGHPFEQKLPNGEFGGYLPSNVDAMVREYRDLSRKGNDQEFQQQRQALNRKYSALSDDGQSRVAAGFSSDAVYPPWSYAPSVLGIKLARALRLPLLWYIYLARVCTLLAWIILVWLALKLLPEGRWFLVVVALLPTSITQASTIGLDGIVCGLSWMIIAGVFSALSRKLTLTNRAIIIGFVCSLLLCIVKQGYWLIALWPVVIPATYYSSKRVANALRASLVSAVILITAAFSIFTRHITSGLVLTPREGVYINSAQQLDYVIHHLFSFTFRVLFQPFTKSFDTVFLGLVGIITNRLVYLSVMVIGLLFLALFLSLNRTKKVPALEPHKNRLLLSSGLVVVGTYLFVSLALYLAFTQVGSYVVEGISGRYFLPLFPLLLALPLTTQPKFRINRPAFTVMIFVAVLAGLGSTIASLG